MRCACVRGCVLGDVVRGVIWVGPSRLVFVGGVVLVLLVLFIVWVLPREGTSTTPTTIDTSMYRVRALLGARSSCVVFIVWCPCGLSR